MKKPVQIAVIGGGAAGMMAAITAARQGSRVTLLERQDRMGRKLLATGNGRCNLTNIGSTAEHYHGADPGFSRPALRRFPASKTMEFFQSLGICTTVEEAGRVFPLTGQASAVLDVLRYEITRLGVAVRLLAPVKHISRRGGAFVLRWPEGEEQADRVILAAGSKAAPQLGGNESGIDLLKQLGHAEVPVFPALVPLKTGARFNRQLKGTKVMAQACLEVDGHPEADEGGEILFTDYGLSGPPIIQLSQAANRARQQNKSVTVTLDLFPSWSAEQLVIQLEERCSLRPEAPLDFVLVGLVHKRFIPVLLQEARLTQPHKPAGQVSPEEARRMVQVLKQWVFEITGSLSWNDSQVMAGGIRTADFSAETMESRIVKGVFAAGEVLDITGDCGGFNLQWAWSSGQAAGREAATA
jgi:predicted Rossmann fold flavoprotein